MDTLLNAFREALTKSINEAFGASLTDEERLADVTPCVQEEFGHYQCNSALRLSKILKKNPRAIAQELIDHFQSEMLEKVEIAGPGFINITLSKTFLSKELQKQLQDPLLGAPGLKKKKRIIVEFSSPNIAKELHVGHIRSTIIGDCLARLFEFLGHDVLRLNHLGDWGTQFGMLITFMKDHCPDVLSGKEATSLNSLMNWYKQAKKTFDEDPQFKKRAQAQVVSLQGGDKEALHAWKVICDISRKGFQEIYDLLDVHIVERGESFYNPFLKETVDELDRLGLVKVSDGAKCIYLEGFKNRDGEPLPLIIQKSDGGYNYATTDLAALHHRLFKEKAERIILVVDVGQSLHFQMVFAAAQKAGWIDSQSVELNHVGFGLVLGEDGKKFKTRSGETEKLIDLLDQAVIRAKEVLIEKETDVQGKELDDLAKTLGIGAVKYADLSSLRTKDYTFSYDKMLRFEGNTAVFLLYAYVRINGIKRKAKVDMQKVLAEGTIQLEHPSEITLGLHLRRFAEVLEVMARDLLPNRLTDYLYELAEKFNAFFRDCRVVGSAEEKSRLLLSELTAKVLKQGFEILGLKTVERL